VLRTRFQPGKCLACGSSGSDPLRQIEIVWCKQIGKSAEHHVRIEHRSLHAMCASCWSELRSRRRWFWPIRYASGFALAAAICGIVTVPVLLYCMRLNTAERREMIAVGAMALVLLPAALVGLAVARRFSVPATCST
jgi:hypothetical protein